MTRQLIACAAMVMLLGGGPAAAQSIEDFELNTAADLLDVCAPAEGSRETDVALAFCYGYIVGGADLYARLVQAKAIEPWACAEPIPQLTEIRSAFVDWASRHDSALRGDPADAFWEAMTAAYPCQ